MSNNEESAEVLREATADLAAGNIRDARAGEELFTELLQDLTDPILQIMGVCAAAALSCLIDDAEAKQQAEQ